MEQPGSIRVVIADDHPVVRHGIVNMLGSEPDITVVGETGDGCEIGSIVSAKLPDVLVLDINMPGLDAVETTARLSLYKNLKILILTAYDDDAYVKGLLSAGASGYVLKDEAQGMLLAAIRSVARGETWLSQKIAARFMRRALSENDPKADDLTQREREVLRFLSLGLNNEDIAEKLFISKRTVQNYVSNIYSKLSLASRTEAMLYSIRHGIVNVDEVEKL